MLRTALYTLGVFLVLLLEKGFEGRHDYHGFLNSLKMVFEHADVYHVWVNIICVSGALFVYNLFTVVHWHLGSRRLIEMFNTPLPGKT